MQAKPYLDSDYWLVNTFFYSWLNKIYSWVYSERIAAEVKEAQLTKVKDGAKTIHDNSFNNSKTSSVQTSLSAKAIKDELSEKACSIETNAFDSKAYARINNKSPEITVFLKMLTSKVTPYVVGKHSTIRELKKQVEDKENIRADTQRLLYAGKQLSSDSETLENYGIGDNATLDFCLQLKGD